MKNETKGAIQIFIVSGIVFLLFPFVVFGYGKYFELVSKWLGIN